MNLRKDLLEHPEVDRAIKLALDEDGVDNDLTTQCCDAGQRLSHAVIIAKSDTVAAGAPLVELVLNAAKIQGTSFQVHADEGSLLRKGDTWLELKGPAADLLRIERTILNYLMRMCGIATATRTIVEKIQGTSCQILHTRKTAPGHRRTDIYAALQGGAGAHRRSLDDAILAKENHFRASTSYQALYDGINRLRAKARFVEIEVTNFMELKHALAVKPDRILLDNFTVADVQKAVMLFGSSVQLEASGGINLETARAYADTGVDYISTGWITHSAPAADLSLLFDIPNP